MGTHFLTPSFTTTWGTLIASTMLAGLCLSAGLTSATNDSMTEYGNAVTENVNGLRHSPLIKQQHRLIDTLMHQQNMFIEQLMSTAASQQRIIEDLLYSKVELHNVDRHKSRNVGSHSAGT